MMIPKFQQTAEDPVAIALRALAWTLSDPARADRMLALTGLDADDLRNRATEPTVLAALLAFIEAHEPDLIACAEALGTTPQVLVAAREALEA